MIERGTLDLNSRPLIHNDDGSVSSEYSTSFGDSKGREILVPTVVTDDKGTHFLTPDGKKPKEGSPAEEKMFQEAQKRYIATGKHTDMLKPCSTRLAITNRSR
jgi:hypothetical protein